MINLVKIEEHRYMVDVGFGSNNLIHPLKLDHSGSISKHITPASMRLQCVFNGETLMQTPIQISGYGYMNLRSTMGVISKRCTVYGA